MDLKMSALILGGICILVLAIGVLRRRAEIILNFLVRTVLGVLAIYIGNAVLMGVGIEQAVGMNAISVLTVGSLGTICCENSTNFRNLSESYGQMKRETL